MKGSIEEYINIGGGGAVDVETYIPSLAGKKYLEEKEYFNVILVRGNQIKTNNLFSQKSNAYNNFVNLICEYADFALSKQEASKFIEVGHFMVKDGFIQISRPNNNLDK